MINCVIKAVLLPQACGFELLVCNAGGVTPLSSPPAEDASPTTDAITANPRWSKYKKTLADRGYFRVSYHVLFTVVLAIAILCDTKKY